MAIKPIAKSGVLQPETAHQEVGPVVVEQPALLGASSTQLDTAGAEKQQGSGPTPVAGSPTSLTAAEIVAKWADNLGRCLPSVHQRAHWELVVEALPALIAALDAR